MRDGFKVFVAIFMCGLIALTLYAIPMRFETKLTAKLVKIEHHTYYFDNGYVVSLDYVLQPEGGVVINGTYELIEVKNVYGITIGFKWKLK